MKSSRNGLMNQIRRVLFSEEEERENSESNLQGGNLAILIDKPKSRRGQRQKWSQQASNTVTSKKRSTSVLADIGNTSVLTQTTSRARSAQGMSVLADIDNESVLSQTSSHRLSQSVASTNSLSVLAGIDDESVVSQSSSREKNVQGQQGGLLSLFAMPAATKKPNQVKRKEKGIPVDGGLLGAVGVEDTASKNRKEANAKRGKRGRHTAKRVSWASESSLVSTNVSIMATEPKVKSQRNARPVNGSVGSSLAGSRSNSVDNGWPMASADVQPSRRQQKNVQSNPFSSEQDEDAPVPRRTLKPAKRKNVRKRVDEVHGSSDYVQATTPEKDDPGDTNPSSLVRDEAVPVSRKSLKPAKRKNVRESVDEVPASSDSVQATTPEKDDPGDTNPSNLVNDEAVPVPQRTLKPVKRKNVRESVEEVPASSESPQVTTPEKDDSGDTFMTAETPPDAVDFETTLPDSESKPTKRKDTKRTPEKLETEEWSAEKKKQPESPRMSNELASSAVQDPNHEEETKPHSPIKPSSKVIEVEYIAVSVSLSAYAPSPANAIADQETRRSLRLPIPTGRFSPSGVALKEAKSNVNEKSLPASPSSASSSMETDRDTEPVKRRSARTQMQTDRFSPSMAMKQAQLKANKPLKDVNGKRTGQQKASKAKNTKSILRKERGNGRPPKSRRDASKPSSVPPNASNESNGAAEDKSKYNAPKETARSESLPSNETATNDSSTRDEWNKEQLLQLKQSHSEVNPTSTSFWNDIAQRVDGKSAQECREKWFSLVKTPAPRAKKAARKELNVDVPVAATAVFHSNDEDDIFNSTPLRGTLFPNNTKSLLESEETNEIYFDVGSPVMMSARRDRRVSTEYDDGNETQSFQQQKFGYKSYMMGLKRGVAQALQEKKDPKKKKDTTTTDGARTLTESVGNGDVSLKGNLTPGGTLKVKNLTEAEDDFLDFLSETSDCED